MAPSSYENANDFYDIFNVDHHKDILNVGLESKIESFPKIDIKEDFYAA